MLQANTYRERTCASHFASCLSLIGEATLNFETCTVAVSMHAKVLFCLKQGVLISDILWEIEEHGRVIIRSTSMLLPATRRPDLSQHPRRKVCE